MMGQVRFMLINYQLTNVEAAEVTSHINMCWLFPEFVYIYISVNRAVCSVWHVEKNNNQSVLERNVHKVSHMYPDSYIDKS